jgi:hypothetical protein
MPIVGVCKVVLQFYLVAARLVRAAGRAAAAEGVKHIDRHPLRPGYGIALPVLVLQPSFVNQSRIDDPGVADPLITAWREIREGEYATGVALSSALFAVLSGQRDPGVRDDSAKLIDHLPSQCRILREDDRRQRQKD